MQFIQFSWQGDPQLLVEGQSFKPVFQLLERRTGGGGESRESREGTQRGWGLKQEFDKAERKHGSNMAAEVCRARWHLKVVVCFYRFFEIK